MARATASQLIALPPIFGLPPCNTLVRARMLPPASIPLPLFHAPLPKDVLFACALPLGGGEARAWAGLAGEMGMDSGGMTGAAVRSARSDDDASNGDASDGGDDSDGGSREGRGRLAMSEQLAVTTGIIWAPSYGCMVGSPYGK